MGARHTARERALQALFALDDPKSTLTLSEAIDSAFNVNEDAAFRDDETKAYAVTLVEGVRREQSTLDALIEEHSLNWRIDRMSRIDRNVLRLGAYELKYCSAEVPVKVVLNEAVELGKNFGNQESSAFVNGLLDRIAGALKP